MNQKSKIFLFAFYLVSIWICLFFPVHLALGSHLDLSFLKRKTDQLQKLKATANKGDAQTQFILGIMYKNGQSVPIDYKKAIKWLQKAANQGNAQAQCALGIMYAQGQGVSKNEVKAVELYQKAAFQGHLESQFILGMMCNFGKNVTQNDKEKIKWQQKTIDQGHAQAQFNFEVIYRNGQKEGIKRLQKAADQGHAKAQFVLGVMYKNGQGVPIDYEEAITWLQKAADQGHALAQGRLAFMYDRGQGVIQDCLKAIELAQQASQSKESYALSLLGWMKLLGRGIQRNSLQAFQHWDEAAQLDQKESAHYVTLKLVFETEVEASKDQIKCYKEAFHQREQEVQKVLGITTNLTEDFYASKADLKRALERGDRNAYYLQALRYLLEIGKNQDMGEVIKYLKRAARENHLLATVTLQKLYHLGQGIVIDELECLKWQIHLFKYYHLTSLHIDNLALHNILSQFQSVGWSHEILEHSMSLKKIGDNVKMQDSQKEEGKKEIQAQNKKNEIIFLTSKTSPQRISTLSDIKDQYDVFLFDMGGVVTDGIEPFPYAIKTINLLANQDNNKKVIFISNSARPSKTIQSALVKHNIEEELIHKGNIQVIAAGDVIRRDLYKFYKDHKIYHFSFGKNKNEDLLKDMPQKVVDHPNKADLILLSQFIEKQEGQEEDQLFADYDEQLKAVAERTKKDKKCLILCANPDIEAFHGSTKRYCAGAFAKRLREKYQVPEEQIISYGKPDQKIYDYIDEIFPCSIPKNRWIMVGDTLSNDIEGAKKFGIDSILVLTGNTQQEINNQKEEEDIWGYLIRYYQKTNHIAPLYIMDSLTDDFL